MIVESWIIASEHITRRWWWVRVHDTPEDLRAAAHKHRPLMGKEYWSSNTIGVCHPVRPWIAVDDNPDSPLGPLQWPANGQAGIIRLASEHLYPEVIYHEILHAACATYRMNVSDTITLGSAYDDMDREEDLAYIYGQLAADMDAALRKRIT